MKISIKRLQISSCYLENKHGSVYLVRIINSRYFSDFFNLGDLRSGIGSKPKFNVIF